MFFLYIHKPALPLSPLFFTPRGVAAYSCFLSEDWLYSKLIKSPLICLAELESSSFDTTNAAELLQYFANTALLFYRQSYLRFLRLAF